MHVDVSPLDTYTASGWLWQAPLKLYNSMPNSCLTGWIHELDAAYFQVSPEMGLKAQQEFQRIVYLPDYIITSFIILFMTLAAEWEFYLQFLEHNGEPYRLTASAYIAQMRISVTAKTSLFVDLFLAMDDAKQKKKEGLTKAQRKENKSLFTQEDFSTLCSKMPAIYQRALNYGKVPTPLSGVYPRGDDTGQFQARLAHMGGLIRASTEAFYNNSSTDSRNTNMQAHKAGTDTSHQEQNRDTTNNNRTTRGTKRTTTDAAKPSEKSDYVNPGKITNPIIITDKTGQKCGIFPRRMQTREKDEWLGANLEPKSKKKCRAGATLYLGCAGRIWPACGKYRPYL
jgi:hypothetical protein